MGDQGQHFQEMELQEIQTRIWGLENNDDDDVVPEDDMIAYVQCLSISQYK